MSKSEARVGADAGVGRHPGFEEHDDRPSTRFKDLIDLVAIQAQCRVAAAGARQALENESRRRGIALPSRFDVPDYELWKRGYAGEARRTVGLTAPTVDDALDVVRPFLDPLLQGSPMGAETPTLAVGPSLSSSLSCTDSDPPHGVLNGPSTLNGHMRTPSNQGSADLGKRVE